MGCIEMWNFMALFIIPFIVYCSEPPKIQNARNNAPPEQKAFDLDMSLQYQCYPGYTTNGFARAKCFFYNGTAKWFGPDFTCERKSKIMRDLT